MLQELVSKIRDWKEEATRGATGNERDGMASGREADRRGLLELMEGGKILTIFLERNKVVKHAMVPVLSDFLKVKTDNENATN